MVGLHSCPASSAGIERWFSTVGFIWSKTRNNLGVDKAQKLATVYRALRPANDQGTGSASNAPGVSGSASNASGESGSASSASTSVPSAAASTESEVDSDYEPELEDVFNLDID